MTRRLLNASVESTLTLLVSALSVAVVCGGTAALALAEPATQAAPSMARAAPAVEVAPLAPVVITGKATALAPAAPRAL